MDNPFSLHNKIIVVTGATGVLGHSFINSIAQAGGTVGVLGRNDAVAHERVEQIIQNGGRAIALIADVTSEEQLKTARDKMIDTYGRIDGLVNGAGGNRPGGIVQPGDDIFKLNMEGMREVMDLNLMGTLIPTQIFGPSLVESKGSIVNISSVSAQRTLTRVMGYSMAKAAIDSYTKWFAVELANRYGDAVRMNAIVPGFFLTDQNRTLLTTEDGGYTDRGNTILRQTPFKRFGNADELSGCLIWLLSDASRFVTGTIVNVDGGFNASSGV